MLVQKEIHMLVIDDDEDDFFIIQDLCSEIKSSNIKLDWVSTYDEGARAALDCKYDIFFVDFLLGGKSGMELVEYAVANNCPAPLVLLTGYEDEDIDKRALRAGATDYLAKSNLSVAMIERTIRHSLERFSQLQLFHQQEAKFRGFFEQSQDGIFIADNDWKAIDVNESLISMLDLNDAQTYGELKSVIFPAEELPRFESLLEESGEVSNHPLTIEKNGSELELLVSCKTVRDINNNKTGFQGMVRDITTFKRAEKELARSEQFNLSGRMARIIAHEVRNPLSNISLASGYLEEFEDLDAETMTQYVDILKRNSDRISKLIDDLLNSTRSTELKMESFEPSVAIDRAIKLCSDRLRMKEVALELEPCPGEWMIQGDLEKVTIVLTNIVTNAIEAMDQVEKPRLSLQCSQLDNGLEISIADNGKGMDSATKKRLFDPFFTDRHGGMGLGLSAVKHLMDQHQGKVTVESELGKGTVFRLCFFNR